MIFNYIPATSEVFFFFPQSVESFLPSLERVTWGISKIELVASLLLNSQFRRWLVGKSDSRIIKGYLNG